MHALGKHSAGQAGQHVLEVVSVLHLHMTSHELIQTTQTINATRLEPCLRGKDQ
jgi:hypothetical protein